MLGLASVGVGFDLAGETGALAWVRPALVALGGYLALSGHRTHLYDAMTRQTAVTWDRATR